MRSFSLIGLLLAVAIIGWWAKSTFAPAVSNDPNDRSTLQYWVMHVEERKAMLTYCQNHPQEQDATECQLSTAAQMQVDSQGQPVTNGGAVDQNTGQASDELHAQQDSNSLGP